MRVRVLTPTVVITIALLFSLAPAFTPQATMMKGPQTPDPAKPAKKAGGKKKAGAKAKAMKGVPSGVKACLEHLNQMASTDPMTAYEGHPSEIINDGLLWNDPKSKCSIGTDGALRLKVEELSKAWREKNAEKVKSLLQEIQSAAPQT